MILDKELIRRHNLCHYILHFRLLATGVNKDIEEFKISIQKQTR